MTEDNLWAYHSWVEGVWHPDNLSFLKWCLLFFEVTGAIMLRLAFWRYSRRVPIEWTLIALCVLSFMLSTKVVARRSQGWQLIGFLLGAWLMGEFFLLYMIAIAAGTDFSEGWAWGVFAGSVLVAIAAACHSRRKILDGRMQDPGKSGSHKITSGALRPWGPGIIGLIIVAPALARLFKHSKISVIITVPLLIFCSLFFIAGAGFHVWGVYAKFKYPSFTVKMA